MTTTDYRELQKQVNQKMADLKKEMEEIGKNYFSQASAEVFEQFPNVKQFSWAQYTPYWCDGEPCEFGVNDYFDIDYTDGESGVDISRPYLYGGRTEADFTEEEKLASALADLVNSVDSDTMQRMFGDHVRVIISREGIETEEYDHE